MVYVYVIGFIHTFMHSFDAWIFTDSLNNVKSATVTGCSVAPCTLEKGKNATFKVVFTAGKQFVIFTDVRHEASHCL